MSKVSPTLRRWFLVVPNALFLYALWILFVSKFDRQELLLGIGAAIGSAIAAQTFEAVGLVPFRPRFRDLVQAWRVPWYMVTGTVEIVNGMRKQIFTRDGASSTVLAVPFDVGGDDPQSHARRALEVTYTTITPNFIVLGIALERRLLIYHQILPGPILKMTRALGARP